MISTVHNLLTWIETFGRTFVYWLVDKALFYGFHQRENTGSRLFTAVKPCWTELISRWVTICINYPVLYFFGSQAGVFETSTPSTSTSNVVCGLSFSRSQPDLEGFLRTLGFPSSAKSTPCLVHLAVEGRKLDNSLG